MFVTENRLDEWVRGNHRSAQGVIVELVYRLVTASCPEPIERRFPLDDSIGQSGPDGILEALTGLDPFVPNGRSFWEIGTGLGARQKASSDYCQAVKAWPEKARSESVFVFVTPLSARREWPHTWKVDAQAQWLEDRRGRNEWRDVQLIDGTKLIDWMRQFPAVELWLAQKMGIPIDQVETLEQHWEVLQSIGQPPPLAPQLFLANRERACDRLAELFTAHILQLKLETRFPDQVAGFVAAYVATMEYGKTMEVYGRCVIVSGLVAWETLVQQREPLILIADFDLDQPVGTGAAVLQKALNQRHAVIYSGLPGGIPHPTSVQILNPKSNQIREALQKGGYSDERARILAQKSGGNLTSLLRCIQNLSIMPEWAEKSPAAELLVAQILGGWDEGAAADRAIVEAMSGKPFGEWIETMREVALHSGTPLTQRDGVWKFTLRYEGWYALGPRIYADHLERMKKVATEVFRERDPRLDLPSEQRPMASIYGKVLSHSATLRNGLAEGLALLGTHANGLKSCPASTAATIASLTVREILMDADWIQWASLYGVLPLLAEAAPEEFLRSVERALQNDSCPFDDLFAQETSGLMGTNYMASLLWALETIAWDPNYLVRVVLILGKLAARDTGGSSGNRPANSLHTILLPWLPQTCASIDRRRASVQALLVEFPKVGWDLLINLLPGLHSASVSTRRPVWWEIIPHSWRDGVTHAEYWEQISLYADLAIDAARPHVSKLAALIERLDELPPPAADQLLAHIESSAVKSMPEGDRSQIWTELLDILSKHKRSPDAQWGVNSAKLSRIAILADKIAPKSPALRHQRLFSERDADLYEEAGNWKEQQKMVEMRQRQAIQEIALMGGPTAVIAFASSVQSPWCVGFSFGLMASASDDAVILPSLLIHQEGSLAQFTGSYVQGRFRNQGWAWVDAIDTSQWTPESIGLLLSHMPFVRDTWDRASRLLGDDQASYWDKANANPYQTDEDLDMAVDQLMRYGRPFAAIRCLRRVVEIPQLFDSTRAIRALLAALGSSEGTHANRYDVVSLIRTLQDDPQTEPDDLLRIEWNYLSLLSHSEDASPKFLERRLADNPEFFCEVVRLVFRSKNETGPSEEPTEEVRNRAANAYRLLSEWKTPPGSLADGGYDGDAFAVWLQAVNIVCSETGYSEIAMTLVGQVLIHTPADPDGLWIDRSVAALLDAEEAEEMRSGFRNGIVNSRGAHWVDPTGKPELNLAAKYERQAAEADDAGYPRIAAMMRSLTKSYRQEADRIIAEHEAEDW